MKIHFEQKALHEKRKREENFRRLDATLFAMGLTVLTVGTLLVILTNLP